MLPPATSDTTGSIDLGTQAFSDLSQLEDFEDPHEDAVDAQSGFLGKIKRLIPSKGTTITEADDGSEIDVLSSSDKKRKMVVYTVVIIILGVVLFADDEEPVVAEAPPQERVKPVQKKPIAEAEPTQGEEQTGATPAEDMPTSDTVATDTATQDNTKIETPIADTKTQDPEVVDTKVKAEDPTKVTEATDPKETIVTKDLGKTVGEELDGIIDELDAAKVEDPKVIADVKTPEEVAVEVKKSEEVAVEENKSEEVAVETNVDEGIDSVVINDDAPTDMIEFTDASDNINSAVLQGIEDSLKKKKKGKQEMLAEPVVEPNYEQFGRGLVYNCNGKHWACIDKPAFSKCEGNQQWNKQQGKSPECHTFEVYNSQKDCVRKQIEKIDNVAPTDFCSI